MTEKEFLIRIVEEDGKPILDVYKKLPGHGFYVCPDRRCLDTFLKRRYGRKVDRKAFIQEAVDALVNYISQLISISIKANLAVIGQDNLIKLGNRKGTLLLSKDISLNTIRKVSRPDFTVLKLPSDKLHGFGVVFVENVGIGRRINNIAKAITWIMK